MQWVIPLYREEQWREVFHSPAREVLLGVNHLSRWGRLEVEQAVGMAGQLAGQGKRGVLLWDILMTEKVISEAVNLLERVDLSPFSAIRVQDPGALFWLQQNRPSMPLQLLLENGHHNLRALQGWLELGGEQLERVVFSPQIPKSRLPRFILQARSLAVQTELLVLGPLLLFYGRRGLLGRLGSGSGEGAPEFLQARADSLEGPHKGLSLVENHGETYMFHPKDLGLVEFMPELQEMGLSAVRFELFDQRPIGLLPKLKEVLSRAGGAGVKALLQREYPRPLIKGLFAANKSDVLFPKLKNQKVAPRNENYLGDVVGVEKKKYIAIHLKNPQRDLRVQDLLEYRTPEGRRKRTAVTGLKNTQGQEQGRLPAGEVALLGHTPGVSVKTAVYWVAGEGEGHVRF